MDNPLTVYPLSVFLDTNAFIAECYYFGERGGLSLLKKQIISNKVKLLVSNIVVDEVKKHIIDDITTSIDEIEKTRKKQKRGLAVFREVEEYDFLFNKLPKERMISEAINKFEQYLGETNSEILDNDGVDIDKVLENYFGEKPPFGEGRKKDEFPDAIMISKLISTIDKYTNIYVVSDDGGFIQALDDKKGFTCFYTIKEFLNTLNAQFDIAEKITEYINKSEQRDYICEKITEDMYGLDYSIDGTDCDRKGICSGIDYDETEIVFIRYVDYTLSSIDDINNENGITVTLSFKAEIEFACYFLDEANSIWDSEEGDYFYKRQGTIREVHEVDFDVIVTLSPIEHEDSYIMKEMTFDFSIIELDQHTLIDRERIDDPEEIYHHDQVEAGYTTCPDCGQEITHQNDGGNGFCTNCASRH